MKTNTITAQTQRATIGTPPMFAILCLAIWAVSLLLAFNHQLPGGAIDANAFMVSP